VGRLPTTFTYEPQNPLIASDQLGDRFVYTYYNIDRQTTETVCPNGCTAETMTYACDPHGKLATVTDGLSHTTS
jgi:hypothetical protein